MVVARPKHVLQTSLQMCRYLYNFIFNCSNYSILDLGYQELNPIQILIIHKNVVNSLFGCWQCLKVQFPSHYITIIFPVDFDKKALTTLNGRREHRQNIATSQIVGKTVIKCSLLGYLSLTVNARISAHLQVRTRFELALLLRPRPHEDDCRRKR